MHTSQQAQPSTPIEPADGKPSKRRVQIRMLGGVLMLIIGGAITRLVAALANDPPLLSLVSDNPGRGSRPLPAAALLPLLVFGGLGITLMATARTPIKSSGRLHRANRSSTRVVATAIVGFVLVAVVWHWLA